MALAMPERERLPWNAIRWMLAERYGWTLEYIDNLDEQEANEGFVVQDAIKRFQDHEANKSRKSSASP